MPSDSLVSRVSREMARRLLMVHNLWTVKTLMHQITSSRKRRKVAECLLVMDVEEEDAGAHSYDRYLDLFC